MHKNRQILTTEKVFYIITTLFIGLNAFFLLNNVVFFGFSSLILAFAWFAFFAYDKLYYFIIFLTPLSISLSEFYKLPFDLSMPSEALMIIFTGVLFLKLFAGQSVDKDYIRHPLSITIILYLIWMLYTSITSSLPLVSFKFFLAKIWFIIPMYFFSLHIFSKQKNIYRALFLYIIALLPVIFYTINRHLSFGLYDKQASHFVMTPFYNDHTSYGAVLSMYWVVLFGLLIQKNRNFIQKIAIAGILIIFTVALILSYSRAAWLSLALALIIGLIIYLKIKFRYVFIVAMSILSLIYIYRFELVNKLEKNRQDSSAKLSEQIKSATNIATDASNLERINRWSSAIRMFKERPLQGWGPGTYMFQYAPFQMAREKTIISTNFGDWGNAHSEYFSALIDSGLPGLLLFILMIYFIIKTAIVTYHSLENKNQRILIWAVLVGLISYLIHGFLNNFLDTDKASVPFWVFTAIIISQNIQNKKKNPQPGGAED